MSQTVLLDTSFISYLVFQHLMNHEPSIKLCVIELNKNTNIQWKSI